MNERTIHAAWVQTTVFFVGAALLISCGTAYAEGAREGNAKALLSEGANVRLKDKKGQTALALVQPATDYQHLTGAWTEKGLKKVEAQAEQDAKALRELLERAGGKE